MWIFFALVRLANGLSIHKTATNHQEKPLCSSDGSTAAAAAACQQQTSSHSVCLVVFTQETRGTNFLTLSTTERADWKCTTKTLAATSSGATIEVFWSRKNAFPFSISIFPTNVVRLSLVVRQSSLPGVRGGRGVWVVATALVRLHSKKENKKDNLTKSSQRWQKVAGATDAPLCCAGGFPSTHAVASAMCDACFQMLFSIVPHHACACVRRWWHWRNALWGVPLLEKEKKGQKVTGIRGSEPPLKPNLQLQTEEVNRGISAAVSLAFLWGRRVL